MKRLIAFLVLIAGPVHAAPLTSGVCNDLWSFAETAFHGQMTSSAVMLGGPGCAVRDVVIAGDSKDDPSARIKAVSFRGTNLAVDGDWLRGDALKLSLDDLRIITGILDQDEIDVDLAVKRGGDDWQIEALDAVFPGGDSLAFSATIAGLDLTSKDSVLQSAPGASVTALDLSVSLLGDGGGVMPILLTQIADEDLPAAGLSPDSRAALKAMGSALPAGNGTLRVTLTSPDGLAVASMMAAALLNKDDPSALLSAVLGSGQFDVVWTPGD